MRALFQSPRNRAVLSCAAASAYTHLHPPAPTCAAYPCHSKQFLPPLLAPAPASSLTHCLTLIFLSYPAAPLIQLRNPWGNLEWKGAWSDNDAHWTPSARAELKKLSRVSNDKLGLDDGTFWMCAADFCQYFAGVQICRASHGWCVRKHRCRRRCPAMPHAGQPPQGINATTRGSISQLALTAMPVLQEAHVGDYPGESRHHLCADADGDGAHRPYAAAGSHAFGQGDRAKERDLSNPRVTSTSSLALHTPLPPPIHPQAYTRLPASPPRRARVLCAWT